MAWGESKTWKKGTANQALYQALLDHAAEAPARNAKRKKVLHPEDMPWELSRHGLLKHLMNEQMNTRMETVDAYMLIIPALRHGEISVIAPFRYLVLVWAIIIQILVFSVWPDGLTLMGSAIPWSTCPDFKTTVVEA